MSFVQKIRFFSADMLYSCVSLPQVSMSLSFVFIERKIYKKPLGNNWIDFISTVRCSIPHPSQIPSHSTIHIAPVCHIHPKICYIDNFTRSMCRGAVVLYQDVTTWGFTLQKLGNPKAKTTSHPLCLLLTRTRAEMRASDHRIT